MRVFVPPLRHFLLQEKKQLISPVPSTTEDISFCAQVRGTTRARLKSNQIGAQRGRQSNPITPFLIVLVVVDVLPNPIIRHCFSHSSKKVNGYCRKVALWVAPHTLTLHLTSKSTRRGDGWEENCR